MNFRRRFNRFCTSRSRGNSRVLNERNVFPRSLMKNERLDTSCESQIMLSNPNVLKIHNILLPPPSCPFPGWSLYFPCDEYDGNSDTVLHIHNFIKYLHSLKLNTEAIDYRRYAVLSYIHLCTSTIISDNVGAFVEIFENNPKQIIIEISLALHTLLYKDDCRYKESDILRFYVHARIINYSPILYKCSLKASQLGQFVSVRGAVVRVSQVKPVCTRMNYSCLSCKNEQIIILPDGYRFAVPTKCDNRTCKSKTFQPVYESDDTYTIDYQIIRVQETGSDCPVPFGSNSNSLLSGDRSEGRIPRTINCILIRDLVDSCVPGDEIVISGIVVAESASSGFHGSSANNCLFNLILQTNSLYRLQGSNSTETTLESELNVDNSEFSAKDLYAIEAIHSEPDLFRLLVASLCPSIYGHEFIKASLLLALFGGVTKFGNDKNKVEIRGNSHVLIVGDPGLGKSQMLQSACAVAPRSVYVCGSTASAAGLTVTFSKDTASDNCLEAGALVISDQGCCCIDEFDKMSVQQHSSLLEAMEQQSISVAKAGMVCNLSARTSILAAANPSTGHYDKSKTVSENLKMSAPLLSRFDLVFIMLDRPNEVMDAKLSKHVLSLHTGRSRSTSSSSSHLMDAKSFESLVKDPDSSFQERLSFRHKEICDPIPPQLLRKYIIYARKFVHPKLNQDAANMLQDFYLSLRKRRHSMDGTPITTRQLESLVRLTEARARSELRELATIQDAMDVKELMLESMMGVYSDEMGLLNFSRSQGGSGMSKGSAIKKLISLLQTKAERSGSSLFTMNDIRELAMIGGINGRDLEQVVSTLNLQGFLLKKGLDTFKFLTAGF